VIDADHEAPRDLSSEVHDTVTGGAYDEAIGTQ